VSGGKQRRTECRSHVYDWLHGVHNFRGRKADRITPVCNPLLRADWNSSSDSAREWATAIRGYRTASFGSHPEGAADWLYPDGNQATILWISSWDAAVSSLAPIENWEDCRTGSNVAAHPDDARSFGAAREVPLHGARRVRQEDLREAVREWAVLGKGKPDRRDHRICSTGQT